MTPTLHLGRGCWKTAGEGHGTQPGFQKFLLGIISLQLHVSTSTAAEGRLEKGKKKKK